MPHPSLSSHLALNLAHIALAGLLGACGASEREPKHSTSPPVFEPVFGRALALGGDLLAVAGDGIGAVYLYREQNGEWRAEQRLRVENPSSRYGGSIAVAPSARVVAVGSLKGEVDVFRQGEGGRWTRDHRVHPPALPKLAGRVWFGASVAMNDDFLVVGAPLVNTVDEAGTLVGEYDGAVFVYRFRTKLHDQGFASWNFVARIDPPASLRGRGLQFGRSVQIDAENRISVGGLTGQDMSGAFHYEWVEAPFRDQMRVRLEWKPAGRMTWENGSGQRLERFTRIGDRMLAIVTGKGHRGRLQVWDRKETGWVRSLETAPPNGASLAGTPVDVAGSVIVRGVDPTPPCATLLDDGGGDSRCPPRRPEVNGLYLFDAKTAAWQELETNGTPDPRDRALAISGPWLAAAGYKPRTVVLYQLPRNQVSVIGPPVKKPTPVTPIDTNIGP